ncbi:beta-lactamase family protein [Hymenobacter sp. RP-2-7]|uniref:Beta-lactamase family protein n=1 Tax=Hymenobacter polaris TaxID=2682546 RepID=A0A7Y0AE69_9BACT|nr:serine hydrolase domain-containing protein [Hymenobacter polaris]NML65679.1 beta-lactamase family protein [Hymenobacter polaris]
MAQTAAQQALDSLRVKYHLPAMLAAVIQPQRICYVYGGVRRSDQTTQITLTDYFHFGSDTKGVTSLLAGKLVEQGKIRWESKLLDVVPSLRTTALPAYADVTLAALLSHRAGIPPYDSGAKIRRLPAFSGTVRQKRQQFAAFVLQQPPVLPGPGEVYAYSNAGYALAALMLEQVSQRSWEELVARAFHKLKLHYVVGFPNRGDAQQPWGHWRQAATDSVLTPLGPLHPYHLQDFLAPAGDLAMPLPDYARLIQKHLRGLLGHANYLKAKTYQLLHFGKPSYAYGWGVLKLPATGAPVSFHNGTAGTFYCHTILYPSQQVALIVLTNAGGEAAEAACYALHRRLKQLYLQGQLE